MQLRWTVTKQFRRLLITAQDERFITIKMRLTNPVWTQHLGRMIKRHWYIKSKIEIKETGAEKNLAAFGIPVIDISEVVKDIGKIKSERINIDIPNMEETLPIFDEKHPEYKSTVAYLYKQNSLLVGGLEQAQLLSKAVCVGDKLPQYLEDKLAMIGSNNFDDIVQNSILSSHLFDAYQEKLPIIKDPERPAWNFPRNYGITDKRRSFLACEKLIQLCMSPKNSMRLFGVNSCSCVVPIEKDGDFLLYEVTLNKALLSSSPLKRAFSAEDEHDWNKISLPDISPMKPTITLDKSHFYEPTHIHPVSRESKFHHLHTVVIYQNETEMKNIYETPAEESQILGRCVLFAFTAAASQAILMFGESIKKLPIPVVIQCIQTDGRVFDLCVFQLNTLDFDSTEGHKNLFWLLPRNELFSSCVYKDGRPTLSGYNSEVYKYLSAFCSP